MFLVLHGKDDFTSREVLLTMINDPCYAYNVERFDGATADVDTVRIACETMPFLSDARLIVVDGLPKTSRGKSDSANSKEETRTTKGKKRKGNASKDLIETLAALAETLPATTTLVTWHDDELPKTHPLFIAATTYGTAQYFAPLKELALEKWIVQRAKHEGCTIAPDAVRALATMTRNDLRILSLEINKLSTYASSGHMITLAMVELLVPDSHESRIFDLTDALAQGKRVVALHVLHDLIGSGESPLGIVAMIARQVRLMIQARDLAGRGMNPMQVAAAMHQQEFIIKKTLAMAQRFSSDALERTLRACLEVDTDLKRSRMTPELALDLLMTRFGV